MNMSEFTTQEKEPILEDSEAARKTLEDQIAMFEGFLAQPHMRDFAASVAEDEESCVSRITMTPPETLGQIIAHFVDIGRLAGLRVLKQRPTEALQEMKTKLKEM